MAVSVVPPRLVARDLVREYVSAGERRRVLDAVTLEAQGGQAIAITGPSGSGKTTLLNLIGGLDRPDSGDILWNGLSVPSLNPTQLAAYRASDVGFVFQDHHLLPYLSARQNVLVPRLAASAVADLSQADALLEQVGVAHRAAASPSELSGGERQRVAIARALVNGAKLLLCDEPTGSLDHETGRHIVDLLLQLVRRQNLLLLLVTHNEAVAGRMDLTFHLRSGRLTQA